METRNAVQQKPESGAQRVLFVDDEEPLAFLARRALSRLGYDVSTFTNPAKALAAFRADPQRFDVVVSDLSMPQMSGFDLARELKALRPDIKIVVATGYIRDEDLQAARAVAIQKIIPKPVSMEELAHLIDGLQSDGGAGAA